MSFVQDYVLRVATTLSSTQLSLAMGSIPYFDASNWDSHVHNDHAQIVACAYTSLTFYGEPHWNPAVLYRVQVVCDGELWKTGALMKELEENVGSWLETTSYNLNDISNFYDVSTSDRLLKTLLDFRVNGTDIMYMRPSCANLCPNDCSLRSIFLMTKDLVDSFGNYYHKDDPLMWLTISTFIECNLRLKPSIDCLESVMTALDRNIDSKLVRDVTTLISNAGHTLNSDLPSLLQAFVETPMEISIKLGDHISFCLLQRTQSLSEVLQMLQPYVRFIAVLLDLRVVLPCDIAPSLKPIYAITKLNVIYETFKLCIEPDLEVLADHILNGTRFSDAVLISSNMDNGTFRFQKEWMICETSLRNGNSPTKPMLKCISELQEKFDGHSCADVLVALIKEDSYSVACLPSNMDANRVKPNEELQCLYDSYKSIRHEMNIRSLLQKSVSSDHALGVLQNLSNDEIKRYHSRLERILNRYTATDLQISNVAALKSAVQVIKKLLVNVHQIASKRAKEAQQMSNPAQKVHHLLTGMQDLQDLCGHLTLDLVEKAEKLIQEVDSRTGEQKKATFDSILTLFGQILERISDVTNRSGSTQSGSSSSAWSNDSHNPRTARTITVNSSSLEWEAVSYHGHVFNQDDFLVNEHEFNKIWVQQREFEERPDISKCIIVQKWPKCVPEASVVKSAKLVHDTEFEFGACDDRFLLFQCDYVDEKFTLVYVLQIDEIILYEGSGSRKAYLRFPRVMVGNANYGTAFYKVKNSRLKGQTVARRFAFNFFMNTDMLALVSERDNRGEHLNIGSENTSGHMLCFADVWRWVMNDPMRGRIVMNKMEALGWIGPNWECMSDGVPHTIWAQNYFSPSFIKCCIMPETERRAINSSRFSDFIPSLEEYGFLEKRGRKRPVVSRPTEDWFKNVWLSGLYPKTSKKMVGKFEKKKRT